MKMKLSHALNLLLLWLVAILNNPKLQTMLFLIFLYAETLNDINFLFHENNISIEETVNNLHLLSSSDNEGTAVEGNTSGDSRNAIIEGDVMVCLNFLFILNIPNSPLIILGIFKFQDETPPINLEHASTDISNLESADIYSSLVTGSLFDDSSEIIEENIVDSIDRNEKKTSDH